MFPPSDHPKVTKVTKQGQEAALRREGSGVCGAEVQTGGAKADPGRALGGHMRNPGSAEGMQEGCEEGELCSDKLRETPLKARRS